MMTRVYLVRHAMSKAIELGVVQGRGIDIPLTLEGERQALALAERLRHERFDRIFASTARRSIQTVESVRAYHADTPYEELPDLLERSKGIAEGVPRDQFRERWPNIQAEWDREEDARPPEGEAFSDVHSRVVPVLEKHVADFAGETLLYVLHGNVNRVLLGHMMHIPHRYQSRIEQGYCAINIAEYDHKRERWLVKCANHSPES